MSNKSGDMMYEFLPGMPEALSEDARVLVERINTLRDLAVTYMQSVRGNMLESMLELRVALGNDPGAFNAVVDAHFPWISQEKATKLVDLWSEARRSRSMQALVDDSPVDAIRFLEDLTDVAIVDQDVESEVGRLLSLPPNRRNKEMTRLIEQDRAASWKRDPADVERIHALEEELDDAVNRLADQQAIVTTTRAGFIEWAEDTDAIMSDLREYYGRSELLLKKVCATEGLKAVDEQLHRDVKERLLSLTMETEKLFEALYGYWLDVSGDKGDGGAS